MIFLLNSQISSFKISQFCEVYSAWRGSGLGPPLFAFFRNNTRFNSVCSKLPPHTHTSSLPTDRQTYLKINVHANRNRSYTSLLTTSHANCEHTHTPKPCRHKNARVSTYNKNVLLNNGRQRIGF